MPNDSVDIAIAADEVVLREYHIAEVDYRVGFFKKVKMPKKKFGSKNTTGTVYVTNRRLIYNIDNTHLPLLGLKCKDLYCQQIRIEDILGVDFMVSTAKNAILKPLLLLILCILGAIFLPGLYFIGIPILIIDIIWLIVRIRNVEEHMAFGVRGAHSDYSIFVSEMSRGYYGRMQYWCAPTEDFEIMSKELGAIVLDLQKYGDDAIGIWVNTSTN